MRKQTMEVELDGRDEPLRVTVDGRDIRRWEAANEKSFITEPISYTTLTELAGWGAVRQGLFDGKHKDFMDAADQRHSGGRGGRGRAPPYQEGSWGRLVVALAVHTHIPHTVWEADPTAAMTAMDLLGWMEETLGPQTPDDDYWPT